MIQCENCQYKDCGMLMCGMQKVRWAVNRLAREIKRSLRIPLRKEDEMYEQCCLFEEVKDGTNSNSK